MMGIVFRIAGLALLNSLFLTGIWYVSPRLIDWPRGVAHGIGMYYLWIFLSVQCLISLILMHVLSLKVTAFVSAGMILIIVGLFSLGGIFGPFVAMISCTALFCATVLLWKQRNLRS